jgi:protein tyrosine phosphatase (PTP) superfamily phosphohydrolase (DUF442 family)
VSDRCGIRMNKSTCGRCRVRVSALSILIITGLVCRLADETASPFVASLQAEEARRSIVHELIRLPSENLRNMVQVHPKVISGGLPDSHEAFEELAVLGVKTIISVDGAIPNVDAANRFGLTYVHLPHGYHGIANVRVKELARAVRHLPGPIYIHCHHGKHRSPAAASVACVSAGLIAPADAIRILEFAGTDPHYRGLYQSAQNAKALDPRLLDRFDVKFRAVNDVRAMAERMVQLNQTHENLKQLAGAGWKTPDDHSDPDAVHEALLLKEHFTELLRTEDVRTQPTDFKTWLRDSETAADNIGRILRQWRLGSEQEAASEILNSYANLITTACRNCHAVYRDMTTTVDR